jgi:hypothetical protein
MLFAVRVILISAVGAGGRTIKLDCLWPVPLVSFQSVNWDEGRGGVRIRQARETAAIVIA